MDEDLTPNRYVASVIAVIVAVIVFATVLIPVVTYAQDTAGEEVVYENHTSGQWQIVETHLSELGEDDLVVIRTNVAGQHYVSINGEEYHQEDIGGSINWLMSDGITLNQNSAGSLFIVYMPGYVNRVISAGAESEITLSGGNITLTYSGGTITGTYTWAYYYDPDGEYVEVKGNGIDYPYYLNSVDQVICAGYYSTGDNDCYYSAYKGTINTDGEFDTGWKDNRWNKIGTTTDVYSGYLNVTIGDESFAPYIVLVPNEVQGHLASGIPYMLWGIVPAFVVLSLLLAEVTIIRGKYTDFSLD